MRIGFIILFTFLFTYCKNDGIKDPLKMFDKEEILIGEYLALEEDILGNPMKVLAIDSVLVLIDYYDQSWLNIISLNTCKQILKCLKQGKGPNEVQRPYKILQLRDSRIFQIYDIFPKKLVTFNLDSILINRNTMVQNSVQFDLDSSKYFQVVQINDTLYLGSGVIFGGKYCFSDKNGKVIKITGDYPIDNKHLNSKYDVLGMAYQGFLEVRPNGGKVVWANQSSGLLEVFDVVQDNLYLVKRVENYLPDYEEERDDMGGVSVTKSHSDNFGYRDLAVTQNYIYALYSGRCFEEFDDAALEGEFILVFDWDGKPVKKIHLDQSVLSICVTEKNQVIYALANTPEPKIIRYIQKKI